MEQDRDCPGTIYKIRVQGQLDTGWSEWFQGIEITYQDGISTLTGPIADQSALRGLLTRIWDLNLTLISAVRVEQDWRRKNA